MFLLRSTSKIASIAMALCSIALLTPGPAAAANPPPVLAAPSDTRMQSWAAHFLAGRKTALESELAADLASPSPHPYAAYVWLRNQASLGRDAQRASELAPPAARANVSAEAQVMALTERDEPYALLQQFPIAKHGQLSPSALNAIEQAAQTMGRLDDVLAFRLARLHRVPDDFDAVWSMLDQLENDQRPSTRRAILAELDQPDLRGKPAEQLLRRVIDQRALLSYDRMMLVKRLWPGDASWTALRYQANEACTTRRMAACAELRKRAELQFPFDGTAIRIAAAMIGDGHLEDAASLLRERAPLRALPGAPASTAATEDLVEALALNANYGELRKVLSSALPVHPDSLALHAAMARLESHAKRYVEAAQQWREVLRLAPHHAEAWLGLINAHSSANDPDGADGVWLQTMRVLAQPTPALVTASLELLQQRNGHAEVIQRALPALQQWPYHVALLRTVATSQAALKNPAAAISLLKTAMAANTPSEALVKQWLALVDLSGSAAGDAALTALMTDYPALSMLADINETRLLARHGNDRRVLRAPLQAALARAPEYWWPYYYLGWEEMQSGDGDAMHAIMEQGLKAVADDLGGRSAQLHAYSAEVELNLQGKVRRPSASALTQAWAALDQAEALGISQAWLARRRASVLEMQNKSAAAVEQLRIMAKLAPDDAYPVNKLMRSEEASARTYLWRTLDNYIKRDPDDPSRLSLGLEIHAKWGGSPVVALSYGRQLKERFPSEYASSGAEFKESQALQHLGAYQQHYRLMYDGTSALSPSERYIGWFDTARKRAQENPSFLVEEKLDLVNMRAVVVAADGIEVERGWHPVSGKLTYSRVGRAAVTATYDNDGDLLLGLSDTGGGNIRIDYNAEGNIARIVVKNGEELEFAYNPAGKPVQIKIAGLGTLNVSYNATGEIESVKSDGGAMMALRLTQAFQELLSRIRSFSREQENLGDLPFKDAKLDALFKRADTAQGAARTPASLDLAAYLVEHAGDRRSHAADAWRRIDIAFDEARRERTPAGRANAARALGLWHALALQMYRHGLPDAAWQRWNTMRDWMAEQTGLPATLQTSIAQPPLVLTQSAHWMARSMIDNPGAWRRYPSATILPRNVAGNTSFSAMLIRRNGDLVLGSARGLSVLRKGFWEWFGYDASTRQLSQDMAPEGRQPAVLALAEDSAGRLWIGQEDGLLRIDGDYAGPAVRHASAMQGLDNARIDTLLAFEDGVLAGTPTGLRRFNGNGHQPLPQGMAALASAPVRLLRAGAQDGPELLIGTDKALQAWHQGALQPLLDQVVQDASYLAGTIYTLRNNEVRQRSWAGKEVRPFVLIQDHANIVFSRTIDALGEITLDDGRRALTVLTDQGISVYHNAHFEHKKLPMADSVPAVLAMRSTEGKSVLSTSAGLYVLQAAKANTDSAGMVHALLSIPEQHATFVARGDRLEAVVHGQTERGARPYARIQASHLARLRDGSLISNDGSQIVRFAPGSTDVQEVFDAAGVDHARSISSLLVDSEDTIWVTAGASVFRHQHGETEEFSILIDEEKFPARSRMISRVIETMDHRIWVVASNEGHLYYQGRATIGGLLEWSNGRFERITNYEDHPWFMTSYTQVSPDQAIVGTVSGFATHRPGKEQLPLSLYTPSYLSMRQRQPMQFLGTNGAPMGEDNWFFGSAGGLVAWHRGRWIMPDRLNWLLPDQHLSAYGARAVHAVATDAAGHLYAGTDRGLLIYDTGGNDFMQFLLSEDLPDLAFADLESDKLQEESRAFLASVPAGSKLAGMVSAYKASQSSLMQARAAVEAPASSTGSSGSSSKSGSDKPAEPAKLGELLDQREQAHKRLLAKLEKDNLGLYQMLELKPIELSSLHKRLRANEAIVQYLPDRDALMIQVVTQTGTTVKKVDIKASDLMARSQAVARALTQNALQLNALRAASVPSAALSDALLRDPQALQAELHALYQVLLRPIEDDLAPFQHVYIAPVGTLTHLPFGALVRTPGPAPVYAAQRYMLGALPSLYFLNLVLNTGERSSGNATLFGNPDETLSGAQRETASIGKLLGAGTNIHLGADASLSALREQAPTTRWLHLATHGKLNPNDPTLSYLVLGNGTRLNMYDATQLDLGRADMVVLSACESGLGATGLEYANLARSFAMAGAPTVVASLWSVNDDATEVLMVEFYAQRKAGKSVFEALALAQRAMLERGGKFARPEAWSAFIAFGRP